jgi:2-phosphosulfolactate phosphatase
MKNIEIVYTPKLLPLYDLKGKTVVVIDILRATSTMCVAFETGIDKILPVSTPEECSIFKDFDFLTAAERNAEKLPGFDMGNSPFEFLNPLIEGKKIAFTTTNGTKAIKLARQQEAAEIVIGSFLNIDAVERYLIEKNRPVVLLCAGWKDKYNLETMMPYFLSRDRKQFTAKEANDSRLCTKLRWVVEVMNGLIKAHYRLYDHIIEPYNIYTILNNNNNKGGAEAAWNFSSSFQLPFNSTSFFLFIY